MTENEFIPTSYTAKIKSGTVTYRSPSNIALVKYWGKRDIQIPENPSVSFTLNACATTTTITFDEKKNTNEAFSFDLLFEGKPMDSFKPKILVFMQRIEKYLPFLKEYHFTIATTNSFPHSSGIASSASGMSALALCFMDIEKRLNPNMTESYFTMKASFLARLGSGSACRSVEGDIVQWGKHEDTEGSSDLYGIKYPYKVHEIFRKYHDTILLIDKGEKQVSSTLGHDLMHSNVYAKTRFKQAHENLSKLKTVFAEGDLKSFTTIVESEALTLHAMMMTSIPYFILMKPKTMEVINEIWKFRAASNTNVCFTLDAGANVHVLYPEHEKDIVYPFIKAKLVPYCQNGAYITDRTGFGAKKNNTP